MSGKSGRRLPAAARATAGQFAYEPVRRRTRADAIAVALDDAEVAPRGLSTRPTPIARSEQPVLRPRPGARAGRAARRACRGDCSELERALLEARLHVAGGAAERAARTRRRRAAGSPRARPPRRPPRARRGRTRRAARVARASTTPTSGIRSMNEPLKRSSRQARADSARISRELARARRRPLASRSSALPPTATEPNRKRWPVSRSFSRRARSVRARSGSCRRRGRRRRRSRRCR